MAAVNAPQGAGPSAPCEPSARAAANWQRAHAAVQHARREARNGQRHVTLVAAGVAEEAAVEAHGLELFGVHSLPSIIDSMRSGRMMPPEPLRGVRVSVLLRSAHGMPPDARAFAKVACGSNRFRTFHVAGSDSPVWQQLFTFDVEDPDRATLVFSVKSRRAMGVANELLGRNVLRLSRVSATPEAYSEPTRLELRLPGVRSGAAGGGEARSLEVQLFMSSKGDLAAMAARGGALSVLAATWNVGNALPPPPEALARLWLRGTSAGAEHHLVAVAAQECSYLRGTRRAASAARSGSGLKGAGSGGRGASDADALRDGDQEGLDTAPSSALASGHGSCGGSSGGARGAAGQQAASLSLNSANAALAAAAVAAHEVADTAADEDDEPLDDEGEGAAADGGGREAKRIKSFRRRMFDTVDSSSAWESHISAALGPRYWLVASRHMFQTRVLLFARMDVVPFITDVWTGFEATGIGRVGLNKGGVGISVRVASTRIAFVGAHLAAHQSQCARRNHDIGEIIEELLPPHLGNANIVTGPDHVVWMGDLNYRLDWGEQAHTLSETPSPADHASIVARVQGEAYGELLATDQLAREMRAGRVLPGFGEAPIAFPPTFKVTKGAPGLMYGIKRSPAYCDRVLWRSNLPHRAASAVAYYCCPQVATSDHKPVAAVLSMPLATVPALCRERRKPFRLYLSNVTFLGVASWANLAAAAGKALTGGGLLGGDALRIVVEGPALAAPGVFKDHAVHLDNDKVLAAIATAAPGVGEEAEGAVGAARPQQGVEWGTGIVRGEASMELLPSNVPILRDAKLLLRLVLHTGPLRTRTLALGVLPLHSAAEAFRRRRFKAERAVVQLETPQGRPFAALGLEAAIFSSARTRSIVADAVRRMRLLAAVGGHRLTHSTSGAGSGTGSGAPSRVTSSRAAGAGARGDTKALTAAPQRDTLQLAAASG